MQGVAEIVHGCLGVLDLLVDGLGDARSFGESAGMPAGSSSRQGWL
ncbi:MAG TPA: hypothetical protein VED66_08175 [Candidatus Sulfotelmatobacter sp.]|nr:hypothetical protein [Candidatus Sulfotelmatobacter sp.]